MLVRLVPAALAGLVLWAAPAAAQEFTSAYTDLDFDDCTVVAADDLGATSTCPGYKGIPVIVGEGDLRFFVSYGPRALEEKAAEQTPPPFNTLGQKIEWRLIKEGSDWRPFATILRYFVQREEGEAEGQVLVVTRLETGATCHVAYIDATANQNANELARQAADDLAPHFDCAGEPKTVGDFAAW